MRGSTTLGKGQKTENWGTAGCDSGAVSGEEGCALSLCLSLSLSAASAMLPSTVVAHDVVSLLGLSPLSFGALSKETSELPDVEVQDPQINPLCTLTVALTIDVQVSLVVWDSSCAFLCVVLCFLCPCF